MFPHVGTIIFLFAIAHHERKYVRQEFVTAALFADVSGFTKMSEALAKRGPRGAEDLSFYLNRYIERLGDILKNKNHQKVDLFMTS